MPIIVIEILIQFNLYEKVTSSIISSYLAHFSAPAQKIKKICRLKNTYFQEMELPNSKIKKFLIFSQQTAFFSPTLKNKKLSYTSLPYI